MLNIICKDGEFYTKGSIDFGITGIHANETFDDDMISIMYCSYDELCTALETDDDFFFEPILPYLQKAERSEEGFTISQTMVLGRNRMWNQNCGRCFRCLTSMA